MSDKPIRVQRLRTKGAKLPPNTVCVTRPGKWGNPFVVHHPNGPPSLRKPMSPQLAVASFRSVVEKEGGWFPVPLPWPKGKIPKQWTSVEDVRRELRGKNLACWCEIVDKKGNYVPCHADVLISIANQMSCEEVRDENLRRAKGEATR